MPKRISRPEGYTPPTEAEIAAAAKEAKVENYEIDLVEDLCNYTAGGKPLPPQAFETWAREQARVIMSDPNFKTEPGLDSEQVEREIANRLIRQQKSVGDFISGLDLRWFPGDTPAEKAMSLFKLVEEMNKEYKRNLNISRDKELNKKQADDVFEQLRKVDKLTPQEKKLLRPGKAKQKDEKPFKLNVGENSESHQHKKPDEPKDNVEKRSAQKKQDGSASGDKPKPRAEPDKLKKKQDEARKKPQEQDPKAKTEASQKPEKTEAEKKDKKGDDAEKNDKPRREKKPKGLPGNGSGKSDKAGKEKSQEGGSGSGESDKEKKEKDKSGGGGSGSSESEDDKKRRARAILSPIPTRKIPSPIRAKVTLSPVLLTAKAIPPATETAAPEMVATQPETALATGNPRMPQGAVPPTARLEAETVAIQEAAHQTIQPEKPMTRRRAKKSTRLARVPTLPLAAQVPAVPIRIFRHWKSVTTPRIATSSPKT
jgi:hypothetical protein